MRVARASSKARAAQPEWPCSRCTFLNSIRSRKCEMCGAAGGSSLELKLSELRAVRADGKKVVSVSGPVSVSSGKAAPQAAPSRPGPGRPAHMYAYTPARGAAGVGSSGAASWSDVFGKRHSKNESVRQWPPQMPHRPPAKPVVLSSALASPPPLVGGAGSRRRSKRDAVLQHLKGVAAGIPVSRQDALSHKLARLRERKTHLERKLQEYQERSQAVAGDRLQRRRDPRMAHLMKKYEALSRAEQRYSSIVGAVAGAESAIQATVGQSTPPREPARDSKERRRVVTFQDKPTEIKEGRAAASDVQDLSDQPEVAQTLSGEEKLAKFLEEIGLSQYYKPMAEVAKVTHMDAIKVATDEELGQIAGKVKMKLGHRARFIRYVGKNRELWKEEWDLGWEPRPSFGGHGNIPPPPPMFLGSGVPPPPPSMGPIPVPPPFFPPPPA